MNSNSILRKLLFAFFILSAFLTACTKIENSTIGGELIPPIDGVITKDTFLTVNTDLLADNDTTTIPITYIHSLGHISNDPLFGRVTASINFQVYPEYTPFSFNVVRKDSLLLDSVVLVLGYRGNWGDTNSNLNLKVYEIAQSQKFLDTTITSGTQLTYAGLLGSRNNIDPKTLDDSVKAYKDTVKNQLRIKLDNSFGTRLLNVYDSSNAYKTDTLFNNNFNGFGVVPDPTGNVLLHIALNDANTKLAIYYRVKNRASGLDTSVTYFKVKTSFSSNSNYIKRDRTGSEMTAFLPNSATEDSLLHLQSAPGTYAVIKIPGLSTFPNALIHRAELQFQQVRQGPLDDIFTAPGLFLTAFSQDSLARFLIPNVLSVQNGIITNLNEFGSYPVRKFDANNNAISVYNFDITRYVQQLVTTKSKNYNLTLFAPQYEFVRSSETSLGGVFLPSSQFNYPATGRVRLGGGTHSKQPVKLRIIYSRL